MDSATPPPQLTVKAVLLGIVLSMILAGANAYLGLFAGMTVSASIPAAVISMAILKMFKDSNILENNIVQTAASAGESEPIAGETGDRMSVLTRASGIVLLTTPQRLQRWFILIPRSR